MVSKAVNLGLRAWELICSILIVSLIGNAIASAFSGNPSMVNYDMFVGVFGLASLLYLLPVSFLEGYNFPILSIGLDVLNVLFWFCAAVATPAYTGVHSCSNNNYTRTNHIMNGAYNRQKRCREIQASTAFLWFGWAAWVGSLVISLMSGRGSGVSMRGGIRRGGPSMSQV